MNFINAVLSGFLNSKLQKLDAKPFSPACRSYTQADTASTFSNAIIQVMSEIGHANELVVLYQPIACRRDKARWYILASGEVVQFFKQGQTGAQRRPAATLTCHVSGMLLECV